MIRPFLQRLGFKLTDAQTRVLREIRADLASGRPMRRLLQGDVGSGKTVVAGCAALMTLESGFNVLCMAPTEILAEQHATTFRRWCEPLGVAVRLRTANSKEEFPDREQLCLAGQGSAGILVVGTHALVEERFALERCGLVIIDEQHKFGVVQRERLVRKGRFPHLLVMTATPIPRSLGLTLYGDMEASVIDQLPKGRGPLRTFVRQERQLDKVWDFVEQQLATGRQAYVVCPRIDADPTGELAAVTREWERLRRRFGSSAVGLLHGRLSAEEKERVMQSFRSGTLALLVATSVIEVGIDVPNATVMVIQQAGQFGLAQLHQLRGRIGRGAHASYCILVAEDRSASARERFRVLVETQDGFRVAEADLRLRGPGDMLGQEQSGLPDFRFADLAKDLVLVEKARAFARGVTELEPAPGK